LKNKIYLTAETVDYFNSLSPALQGQCSTCENIFNEEEFCDIKKLNNPCPGCGNDKFFLFKEVDLQ